MALSRTLLAAWLLVGPSRALVAEDGSRASLTLSGVVPAVASAAIELHSSAWVFRAGERVRGRVIGRLRLRYNTDLGAVLIAADRPGGVPSDGAKPYPFGPAGFTLSVGPCPGLDPARTSPIRFSASPGAPTDLGDHRPIRAAVTATCDLLASWDGAEGEVPSEGGYSLGLSLSLVPAR